MTITTPLQRLPDLGGSHVFMKREDLLPMSFGGNKVRIAEEYFADMEKQGCDCMVGYGNARSNLCRILAAMAAEKQVPCCIISPDDEDGSRRETFNSRLVKLCGAEIVSCPKTKVRETVEAVLHDCRRRGRKPYYIYGNSEGKGNEAVPAAAYVKVAAEIAAQEEALGISFHRIYHASATGMTQAGLILGAQELGRSWEILGISIARSAAQCKEVIRQRMEAYQREYGAQIQALPDPLVTDAYILQGYGTWNEAIASTIRDMYVHHGIPLDPTYTGKAYWGMGEELKKSPLPGGNVLFLHTGGGPLFFDFICTEENQRKN